MHAAAALIVGPRVAIVILYWSATVVVDQWCRTEVKCSHASAGNGIRKALVDTVLCWMGSTPVATQTWLPHGPAHPLQMQGLPELIAPARTAAAVTVTIAKMAGPPGSRKWAALVNRGQRGVPWAL
jgi:hypothetical protein